MASNSSRGDQLPLTQSIPIPGLQVTEHNVPLTPSPLPPPSRDSPLGPGLVIWL